MKRNINIVIILAIGLVLVVSTTFNVYGGSVIGSRHDLMYVAENTIHAAYVPFTAIDDYGEICVYCHTPHGGRSDVPLWNKAITTTGFTPYTSTTMDTSPTGTISPVSAACLSCHDGTLAVDSVLNAPGNGANLTGPWPNGVSEIPGSTAHAKMLPSDGAFPLGDTCGECHDPGISFDGAHDQTAAYLTQDLSDDHPISMDYPTPAQDPDFKTTNEVDSAGVVLYSAKVECPSCHNPHDPDNTPFLRISNSGSALCKACHLK